MQTIENPPIPFHYPIGYAGLPYEAEVVIHGNTYHSHHDKSFAVEFRAGSGGQDVAVHINFRFKTFEHVVVLNTFSAGQWEKEERHPNPIRIGDNFRLRIVNHEKHYKIELNEKHLCHFHHRFPAQSVTGLDIKGNVVVHRVHLMNFGIAAPMPQFGAPSAPYPAPNYQPPPAYSPAYGGAYSTPQPTVAPQYSSPQPMAAPQFSSPSPYPNSSAYMAPQPQVVYVGGMQPSCSCDGLHRCQHHRHGFFSGHHHHGHHHHH